MAQKSEITQMLSLMTGAAFLVRDGMILQVNEAAADRAIEPGVSIEPMLQTGLEEYRGLKDGWLCLTLRIHDVPCSTSVTRVGEYHLFLLEEDDLSQLRCFALAGQELRLPLTGISSVSRQFSAMAESSGDNTMLEQSGRLQRSLFQLMRIINNMTDAYRYAVDTVPKQETRNICALLEEQLCGCRDLFASLGTEVSYTVPANHIYCLVDAEKLERAVHNILLNAYKFSPAGSPIQVKLSQKDTMLYLTVQNEGVGSLDSLKNDVFTRYLRAPGMERNTLGIGLGMVLIRATASAQGGTVLLEQSDNSTRVTMSMAIRQSTESLVRSPSIKVDYAGEWNHALLEFAEVLPTELYHRENKD